MGEGAGRPVRQAVGLAAALALADLASKWLAGHVDGTVPLVDVHHNRDLALGVAGLGDVRSLLLAVLAIVAVVQMVARHRHGAAPAWVLPALVGGAAANGVDRAADGAVTDWLAVGPVVLNLADVFLFAALAAHAWGVVTDRSTAPAGAVPDGGGR